jgi:hypothetical protein
MRTLQRNTLVSSAFVGVAVALVLAEVYARTTALVPIWYLTVALGLAGVAWANSNAFPSVEPRAKRMVARIAVSLSVWAAAVLVAVIIGVNLKHVLGGAS